MAEQQSNRAKALAWWRSLSDDAKSEIYRASDYYSRWPFIAFAASTGAILKTWEALQNG